LRSGSSVIFASITKVSRHSKENRNAGSPRGGRRLPAGQGDRGSRGHLDGQFLVLGWAEPSDLQGMGDLPGTAGNGLACFDAEGEGSKRELNPTRTAFAFFQGTSISIVSSPRVGSILTSPRARSASSAWRSLSCKPPKQCGPALAATRAMF